MLDLQMVQKSATVFVLMRSSQTLCIYLAPFKNCPEKVTFSNNFARTYSVNVVLMIMKVKIVGAFLRGIILNFLFCIFPVEHVLPRQICQPELVDIERYV
jgi:thiol:disulfide interchange protein